MGGGGRGDIALQDVRNVGMFVLQYWTNNNTVAFDLTNEWKVQRFYLWTGLFITLTSERESLFVPPVISVVHLAGNIDGSTGRGESFPKYICSVIEPHSGLWQLPDLDPHSENGTA